MAKLKIGQMKLAPVDMPKKMVVDEPVKSQLEVNDIMSMVEKVVNMLPKAEAPKEVNLMPLMQRIEDIEKEHMIDMLTVDAALEEMKIQLDEVRHQEVSTITVPEVKQVTHVKDVSDDVRQEIKALIEKSRMDVHLDMNSVKKELKKQELFNIVLGVLVLVSLFLNVI